MGSLVCVTLGPFPDVARASNWCSQLSHGVPRASQAEQAIFYQHTSSVLDADCERLVLSAFEVEITQSGRISRSKVGTTTNLNIVFHYVLSQDKEKDRWVVL